MAFSKYTEENFEKTKYLHSNCRAVFQEFLFRLALAGIYVRVISGFRTKEEQDDLYARGRTRRGRIVTNARGGESYHNYGLALDIVPLQRIGPVWFKALFRREDLYNIMAVIGRNLGITAPIPWDKGHFQYSEGLSISDLKAGKTIKGRSFEMRNGPPWFERAKKRLRDES